MVLVELNVFVWKIGNEPISVAVIAVAVLVIVNCAELLIVNVPVPEPGPCNKKVASARVPLVIVRLLLTILVPVAKFAVCPSLSITKFQ